MPTEITEAIATWANGRASSRCAFFRVVAAFTRFFAASALPASSLLVDLAPAAERERVRPELLGDHRARAH